MQMDGLRAARSTRRLTMVALVGALFAGLLATGVTQAASATILMQYYTFSPSPLTITAGTTVTWINKDVTQRQVASDTGAFPSSKLLNTGEKYSVTFKKVGTFGYHDGFNGFARGTIIVKAGPKATPKPTPRPTAKATPKPTAKPTTAATPTPVASGAVSASPGASGTNAGGTSSGSPGPGDSAGPGDSGSGGSGGGSSDMSVILLGLGIALGVFLAVVGLQVMRRRTGPPGGPA